MLQKILESVLGLGKIDVVDLTKSNLRIPELKACVGQSLALSPDVLVIFAGNNWHPHFAEFRTFHTSRASCGRTAFQG